MKLPLIFAFLFIVSLFAPGQVLVIAHRGASAVKPENSLSAFEEAIKSGADYIETDVHLTSDGVPVLMHDLSVNRTCVIPEHLNKNGKVYIKDLSYAEFCKLKIKNSNESPPTLDSAIKLINGRCKLLIEFKKGSDYYPGIEHKVNAIINSNNAFGYVDIIHSFSKKPLLEMQQKKTGAKLHKLIIFRFPLSSFTFSGKVEKDDFEAWQGVNSYYRFTGRRLIKRLHAEGKTVYAWTVNRKKHMKKLINKGVDGIITNNPALLKEILAKK